MGFTDFPHARDQQAVLEVYDVIDRDADLAVMHFDDGVPWPEASRGEPYPAGFQDWLDLKASFIPIGHRIYLAVTPIAFERDGLAPYRGDAGSEPLPPPWDRRSFDDPEVIAAFINHCERMIDTFTPEFFAYAVEVNLLYHLAPAEWPAFVRFAEAVYGTLKTRYRDMPIFLTLQADFFHPDVANQTAAIQQVLPFTDYIAVSSYPYVSSPDPATLRADHFSALADLAPEIPFAIAETAWPAETITAPYPVDIPASDETQRIYMERLLEESDQLSARFVTWFFTRDYDAWWESEIQFLEAAPTIRLWKDTGVYDGAGNPRPALAVWQEWLDRPLQSFSDSQPTGGGRSTR